MQHQHHLFEPADTGDGICDSVWPTNATILVEIPETYFDHMIGLAPDTVADIEGVEDFE